MQALTATKKRARIIEVCAFILRVSRGSRGRTLPFVDSRARPLRSEEDRVRHREGLATGMDRREIAVRAGARALRVEHDPVARLALRGGDVDRGFVALARTRAAGE